MEFGPVSAAMSLYGRRNRDRASRADTDVWLVMENATKPEEREPYLDIGVTPFQEEMPAVA